MFTPGAARSTLPGPKLENAASWSFWSEAPTQISLEAR